MKIDVLLGTACGLAVVRAALAPAIPGGPDE
jgi:hypothetical protein